MFSPQTFGRVLLHFRRKMFSEIGIRIRDTENEENSFTFVKKNENNDHEI